MACHTANLAFMALKLGLPDARRRRERRDQPRDLSGLGHDHLRVPGPRGPAAGEAHLVRGAKDGKRNLPSTEPLPGQVQPLRQRLAPRRRQGHAVLADDYGSDQALWPEAEFEDYKDPEKTLPRIDGEHGQDDNHKKEWVEAIRAGKPSIALSNFDYASTLTESMLLGNVAVRSGEAIDYDPATGRITNSSTASQYLKPYFRKGWEI